MIKLRYKNNKNNHIISTNVYKGYIRSKAVLIKMPEKMIADLKLIAKEQNKNLSELIRQTLLDKYHFKLLNLNKSEPKYYSCNIEDMPLEP